MPVKVFVMVLAYSIGLMGVITPYATGPAPVYFGSGFIPRRDFWVLGFVFGLIYLVTLLGVGSPTCPTMLGESPATSLYHRLSKSFVECSASTYDIPQRLLTVVLTWPPVRRRSPERIGSCLEMWFSRILSGPM